MITGHRPLKLHIGGAVRLDRAMVGLEVSPEQSSGRTPSMATTLWRERCACNLGGGNL